ncbi:hypothetical protein Zm00014a_038924 [Zea mays]|uniref:Uncharacterized protein n=1 Tax=Zea mays TaxID=4577 RepID=A0A3L6F4T2_MAIZE|nr:hypothetical protein Zm00014a_038924 [Zea mays]
MAAAVIAGTW